MGGNVTGILNVKTFIKTKKIIPRLQPWIKRAISPAGADLAAGSA
jgi:hypothetical protein